MSREEIYRERMYRVAGAAMKLYNELGSGYSEVIYQECLSIICDELSIPWEREKTLDMYFHDKVLSKKYKADFVCYDDLIVEIKAVSEVLSEHRAQLFNYLRITGSDYGMLINFGEPNRLHTEKFIYDYDMKMYGLIRG